MVDQLTAVVVATAILIVANLAQAQQAKKDYRIGVLSPRLGIESRHEVFRQGLRDLGYIEGQNIVIEWRFAEGKPERLPALATELVNLNVDVIVTYSTPAIQAAKEATKMIPKLWQTLEIRLPPGSSPAWLAPVAISRG